jgi:hypothetical protein
MTGKLPCVDRYYRWWYKGKSAGGKKGGSKRNYHVLAK